MLVKLTPWKRFSSCYRIWITTVNLLQAPPRFFVSFLISNREIIYIRKYIHYISQFGTTFVEEDIIYREEEIIHTSSFKISLYINKFQNINFWKRSNCYFFIIITRARIFSVDSTKNRNVFVENGESVPRISPKTRFTGIEETGGRENKCERGKINGLKRCGNSRAAR